jgi:hypothetical protein
MIANSSNFNWIIRAFPAIASHEMVSRPALLAWGIPMLDNIGARPHIEGALFEAQDKKHRV